MIPKFLNIANQMNISDIIMLKDLSITKIKNEEKILVDQVGSVKKKALMMVHFSKNYKAQPDNHAFKLTMF